MTRIPEAAFEWGPNRPDSDPWPGDDERPDDN